MDKIGFPVVNSCLYLLAWLILFFRHIQFVINKKLFIQPLKNPSALISHNTE